MRTFAPLLLLFCAACGRQASPTIPPDIRTQRLAALDRIAAECQVPRAMFDLVGQDELHLRPRPDEDYRRLDCALTRLRSDRLLRNTAMGYVGNEALSVNNAQAR